jgi:hypothetical protein
MAELITADDLRERFDISKDIDSTRLTPHCGTASRRLRKWVGEDVYANAIGTDTQYDELRSDLKNAEAHLAMSTAIYGLNSPLSSKGVLATAMSTEAKEVRRYLSPKETAELAGYYLDLALQIAGPYLLTPDTPDFSFETVGVDEDSNAGNCC